MSKLPGGWFTVLSNVVNVKTSGCFTGKRFGQDAREAESFVKAGEFVGKLYEALRGQYVNSGHEDNLKSLGKLCVRLAFCLYAEASGMFGNSGAFLRCLEKDSAEDCREALSELFQILNTPPEQRNPHQARQFFELPFISSGLFAEDNPKIPPLGGEVHRLLLQEMEGGFDWGAIPCTVLGSVFECTLNPQTRRQVGTHYTCTENIHKLIDPLFLDDLRAELAGIDGCVDEPEEKQKALREFQYKLSRLTFLDPACGSGQFLIEAYISVRRLENEVIVKLGRIQKATDFVNNPIMVNLGQFYEIELDEFAEAVAKTSLWMAEMQMLAELKLIPGISNTFLSPKEQADIYKGNALRMDWAEVIRPEKLSYIIGNPPFVGYSVQSWEQKYDREAVYVDEQGQPYKNAGKIDYVACWYFKSAQFMQGTGIKAAFVSTNSITQGEQVANVWQPLYERFGLHINFAHRTFRWDLGSSLKAHVHCVIIGFACDREPEVKLLFTDNECRKVPVINPYLLEAPVQFIRTRRLPLCDVPLMKRGSQPTDDGNLILTAEEKDALIQAEPRAARFIRPFVMGKEFLERRLRYCLWLVNAIPEDIAELSLVRQRVEKVREFRLNSKKLATRRKAKTPHLFDEIYECTSTYVAVPTVSSGCRKYIPIDYLSPDIISGDAMRCMEGASLYHFGVLASIVHMAWTRVVTGRLKSDYCYSNTLVYNNFPWPNPEPAQEAEIIRTAQAILTARALYPQKKLAELYDDTLMPLELYRAHRENDIAVMAAYGFTSCLSEDILVAELMERHHKLEADSGGLD